MEHAFLSKNLVIRKVSETESVGVFELNNLYTGYGVTLGNALRRVLLSSLPGAAITQVKIKGVKHEFSSMTGVHEDIIDIILNLKKVRFSFFADEPQTLVLKKKGVGEVTAADISPSSLAVVRNPEVFLASITDKNVELDMELTVEKGLGYVSAEARRSEKLSVGSIALDAIFTPVANVNFEVSNMRLGDRTDYNRLTITIETDKTISPSRALHKAANILRDHLQVVADIEVAEEFIPEKIEKTAKKTEKKTSTAASAKKTKKSK